MYVQRIRTRDNKIRYILVDDEFKVVEVVKDFLKYMDLTRHAENTLKNYAYHLMLYFKYLKEHGYDYKGIVDKSMEIKVLSEFIGWLNELDEKVIYTQYAERPSRRSTATINAILSAVLSFYDYLHRSGVLRELNVYRLGTFSSFKGFFCEMGISRKEFKSSILKLKDKDRKIKTITREEVEEFASVCSYIRDKFLIFLLYESGLRLGEALGLRKSDFIVWDSKIKIVFRENRENNASVKNRAEGEVLIPQYLCNLYCEYLSQEYIENENGYIFINLKGPNRGKAMRSVTVQKLFNRLGDKIGKKINPHMLRHSHATELIEVGGWDALHVKERLRHRQIQTTINTYVHLSDRYKKERFKEFQEKTRKGKENDTYK